MFHGTDSGIKISWSRSLELYLVRSIMMPFLESSLFLNSITLSRRVPVIPSFRFSPAGVMVEIAAFNSVRVAETAVSCISS